MIFKKKFSLEKCKYCETTVVRRGLMREHKLLKHADKFLFHCRFCGTQFETTSGRDRHTSQNCDFRKMVLAGGEAKFWTAWRETELAYATNELFRAGHNLLVVDSFVAHAKSNDSNGKRKAFIDIYLPLKRKSRVVYSAMY